jgi:cell division protein ZapE
MSQSLRSAYRARLQEGALKPDPAQAAAVEALCRLESELNAQAEPSFLSFLKKPKAPRGVYLWGPVGRGKSMLMDLFFEAAPVEKKQRSHFYAFMAEVHGLIGQWRAGDAAERRRVFGMNKGDDPIAPTAALIASQARLLCFDELQVTDIADAMILGRLFEALFEEGVTLVSTSNRPPEDLYKDGINRQLFTPFIELLREKMDVVSVKGQVDYRLDRLRGAEVYLTPADPAHRAGFAELCAEALGPQDYLAIAGQFHTLFLEDAPRLDAGRRNEARRFVTLIDALYEAQGRLVVLAEAEPDDLYPAGDGAFEFERTASRLQEMRSAAWLEKGREEP